MRVFVTGATGFIGSAVVRELTGAGHHVIGLCRSEEKATALAASGAEPYRGTIADPDSLKDGASRSDAIVHLAFNHDFSRFAQNCEDDRRVIETLGAVLAGSGRPLVVTSGTALARAAPGRPAQEDDPAVSAAAFARAASEEAAAAVAAHGVHVSLVRLPQVHDSEKQGLVTYAIELFREKGVCAYVGDGAHRWAAAAVGDVARLYRLALERAEPLATYHAVAEEGVAMRDMVEVIGQRLELPVRSIAPEESPGFFGWLAMFAGHDMPASSAWTRQRLGWQPSGPSLLDDLRQLRRPAA